MAHRTGAERDATLAANIAGQLGFGHVRTREITGLGAVNHVFVVESDDDPCVIRFNRDPLDRDDFAKEEFCLRFARSLPIPSPEVVARGSIDGIPFLVQSFVSGISGEFARSPELWRQLGRYAATLADQTVPDDAPDALFPRFGRDPAENWRLHLQYNLDELTATDRLIELGAYDVSHQDRIREVFEGLSCLPFLFGLNHGDIVPKNTILQPDGALVLLDWGSSSVGLTPHNAFMRLKNPAPGEAPFSKVEIGWFSEGCGVDPTEFEPELLGVELLGAIDLVRWAVDHRPDRLGETVAKARSQLEARFRD